MRFTFALAALAATTAFAAPAAAQTTTSSANIDSRALILQPATIVAGNNLDFGTVVASAVAGTVTVNADPNLALVTASGGATAVTGAQRGSFNGNGEPGKVVTVTVTYDAQLNHSDGVNFLAYTGAAYGDGAVTIRPDGLFKVYVGGAIAVKASQAPGQYLGKVYVDAAFQ